MSRNRFLLKCPHGHEEFRVKFEYLPRAHKDPVIVLKCTECKCSKVIPTLHNSLRANDWACVVEENKQATGEKEDEFVEASKLEKEYGISVVNAPMDAEVSKYCVCGHHVSKHHGMGSAGECIECGMGAHNFHPRKWRRTHNEKKEGDRDE